MPRLLSIFPFIIDVSALQAQYVFSSYVVLCSFVLFLKHEPPGIAGSLCAVLFKNPQCGCLQAAAAAAQRAEAEAQQRAALLQAQQQAAMAALAASRAMLDAPHPAYPPASSAAQGEYAAAYYAHAAGAPYVVAQAPAAACHVDLLAAAQAQAQAAYGALIASQAMLMPAAPHAEPAMSSNPYQASTPGKVPPATAHASPTFYPAVPGGFVPARPEMSDNSGGGNSSCAEPGSPCKLRSL